MTEQSIATSNTQALRFVDAIEKLAFEMRPPNSYTPRFVELCNTLRHILQQSTSVPSATEQKWPHGYGLKVSDNCLWLIWPEGMINLTNLIGTESIPSRRDIAKATRMAL